MSKTELIEKLTIATICNEATDCILKQIVKEDTYIETLKVEIEVSKTKTEEKQKRFEQLLRHSQEKREGLTILLRPKIDTAAIKMNYEHIVKEFLRIYEAGKSGKALLSCQGQGMDGYSQLAAYNSLAGDIIDEQTAHSKEKGQ